MRAAIVGTGGIAGICHVPAIRSHADRIELVAAMDVDADRAVAFCAEHGIPGHFANLTEMLAVAKPDLVHICTPPHVHAEQVLACLDADAWVFCEKPPCLSLAEYDRVTAAERPGGPYVAFVYQQRFGSGARRMRELLHTGELGRPLVGLCQTTWYRDQDYFDVPWRGRWKTEGGGPTISHGIHLMDLMLSLLGDWIEVRAMAGRLDRRVETEDVSLGMVRFASGAMGSVVNSVLSPREESYLRLDLTDATVELRHLYSYRDTDWTFNPAPHVAPERAAAWPSQTVDVPSSHDAQLGELLDCYARGERPSTSGDGGRTTLEFVTGLYKSAFTGLPVTRAEIGPDDPFYHQLHGGMPGWAPEATRDDAAR